MSKTDDELLQFYHHHQHTQSLTIYLPEEVIVAKILPRLPIKSLIRIKSVNKRWNSVISSPYFVRLQLQQSTSSNTNQHLLINHKTCFLSFDYESYGGEGRVVSQCDWDCSPFNIEEDDESLHSREAAGLARVIECNFQVPHPKIYVVGSCDGLVCLKAKSQFLCIWNPSTLQQRMISYPKPCSINTVWGFGYVRIANDYNIVRICQNINNNEKKIQVFSMMENAWISSQDEELEGYGNCPRLSGIGVPVKDVIYWTMFKDHNPEVGEGAWCIIGFDCNPKKLKKVPLPQWQSGGFEWPPLMYAKEGRLCACWRDNDGVLEIGMLMEDRASGHWTKLHRLSHYNMAVQFNTGMLNVTHIGRLAFQSNADTLLLINPDTKPPEVVNVLKIPSSRNVISYTESLISPFAPLDQTHTTFRTV